MDAALPREYTQPNVRLWATAYLAHLLDRPPSEIDLYRGLAEYGLDSMDAVVMAGAMEEHFGVEIDPAAFLGEATLGELIAGIGAAGGSAGSERG